MLPIWAKFVKQNPHWKLKIIGNGKCYEYMQNYIINNGLSNNTEIISETSEIQQYYISSSVLLSTSKAEGLPMTFIEAMSVGVPIIAYDVPTGPADLINNNINGYLIDDDNDADFLLALNKLVSDETLTKLSQGALCKAQSFTINNILKDWDSFLNEKNA